MCVWVVYFLLYTVNKVYHLFQLKMNHHPPGPVGELTTLPKVPSWINGSLLLREGYEKKVEGGERREGRERDVCGPLLSWILTPLGAIRCTKHVFVQSRDQNRRDQQEVQLSQRNRATLRIARTFSEVNSVWNLIKTVCERLCLLWRSSAHVLYTRTAACIQCIV